MSWFPISYISILSVMGKIRGQMDFLTEASRSSGVLPRPAIIGVLIS